VFQCGAQRRHSICSERVWRYRYRMGRNDYFFCLVFDDTNSTIVSCFIIWNRQKIIKERDISNFRFFVSLEIQSTITTHSKTELLLFTFIYCKSESTENPVPFRS
jgi:hypothetical protein